MLGVIFASVGSELIGYGTFLMGIGSVMAVVWTAKKASTERTAQQQEIQEKIAEAIDVSERRTRDHITASRAQTLRYMDSQVKPLRQNQDILLSMVAELDGKVTKRANSRTVSRPLVGVSELKGEL